MVLFSTARQRMRIEVKIQRRRHRRTHPSWPEASRGTGRKSSIEPKWLRARSAEEEEEDDNEKEEKGEKRNMEE